MGIHLLSIPWFQQRFAEKSFHCFRPRHLISKSQTLITKINEHSYISSLILQGYLINLDLELILSNFIYCSRACLLNLQNMWITTNYERKFKVCDHWFVMSRCDNILLYVCCPENCPRKNCPHTRLDLGLGFGLALGSELALGATFLEGNCPRTFMCDLKLCMTI